MDAELLDAYRRTEYRVSDGGFAFTIHVDEPSDSLRTCHAAFGVECSTYVTAWNPRSQPTSRAVNEAAMERLEGEIAARGWFVLHGIGVDPAGTWTGEPSLLVLGLDAHDGVALAREFGQNAIICAAADAVPRLVVV